MSNTGKTFTVRDLPRRRQGRPDAQDVCAALTDRYRVVAVDPSCGRKIIAEELHERIVRTLSPNARVIATQMLMQLTAEERVEVLRAFDAAGDLVNPFTPA